MKERKLLKPIIYVLYPIIDFIIVFGMFLLSYYESNAYQSSYLASISIYFATLALIYIIVSFVFGTYHSLLKNFGLYESFKIVIISFSLHLIFLCISFAIPESILPNLNPFIFILVSFANSFLMILTRIIYRVFDLMKISFKSRKNSKNCNRTLIIGAGSACKSFIDETRKNSEIKNKIVAILDDDCNKIGRTFSGYPIFGPIKDCALFVSKYKIDEVVIAIANISKKRLNEILDYLYPCKVTIKRMPIISECESLNEVKAFNVKIDELLGRESAKLDMATIKSNLKDKTVLVTGAGGSIGSELIRQIYSYEPKKLILFDIYEHGVYDLQQELKYIAKQTGVYVPFEVYIGSTYNEFRVEWLFKHFHPDYVYHAAAYKHVPLMEDSPAEAIRTNVIGTYNVAKMADKYNCHKMTLISTDKAVRPTNVMGATKRFAEMIIQHFASVSKNTHYSAVRFGNVLGSNGSVVPLFLKQIEQGGPLTVTHPEIIRFFMTIPEAVGLILQSSMFAEHGEIYILDMGKPVKIVTLAEKMIRQAGLVPYKDIEIKFTGLRPGEKLYEEILIDAKQHKKTANAKIYVEDPTIVPSIDEDIDTISKVFAMDTNEDIVAQLRSVIKTFQTPEQANKGRY